MFLFFNQENMGEEANIHVMDNLKVIENLIIILKLTIDRRRPVRRHYSGPTSLCLRHF